MPHLGMKHLCRCSSSPVSFKIIIITLLCLWGFCVLVRPSSLTPKCQHFDPGTGKAEQMVYNSSVAVHEWLAGGFTWMRFRGCREVVLPGYSLGPSLCVFDSWCNPSDRIGYDMLYCPSGGRWWQKFFFWPGQQTLSWNSHQDTFAFRTN